VSGRQEGVVGGPEGRKWLGGGRVVWCSSRRSLSERGSLTTASGRETGQRVRHSPLSFLGGLVACCFGGEEATEWYDGDSYRV